MKTYKACWNCRLYSRTARQCHDHKANPKRKSQAIEIAETLGLRHLCPFNPHRDDLAMKMHYPKHPLALQNLSQSAPKKAPENKDSEPQTEK